MTLLALPQIAIDIRTHSAGKPVKLDWLPLTDLRVDPSYQREVAAKGLNHVRKIASEFEWRKFAPVIVTTSGEGGNTYSIIDGQHRCIAAYSLGYKLVPCAIVEAGVQDAAAIFAAVNGTTLRVSALQVFKAALAAGEEWARAVKQACDDTGVIPLVYPIALRQQKPFMTMAVGRLRRTVETHGQDVLTSVLMLVVDKPNSNAPGFIVSRTLDDSFQTLSSYQNWKQQPLRVARKVLESSVMQKAPDAAAVTVGDAPVVPIGIADHDARNRVQDLKQRGFTKSMVAASMKIRYAQVERLWGAA